MKNLAVILMFFVLMQFCVCGFAQVSDYAIGADLSFLKQAEERGTVFKDNDEAKPGLEIFKDHGYNWIRLRLFHTPTRLPNNLEYTIALAKDAKKLQIYGLDSCESMDFKNSSEMYGTIYAPNADVVMHNSSKTYGAIISKSLEWKNSGELHYDVSLRDVTEDDEAVRFVMTNWHEE